MHRLHISESITALLTVNSRHSVPGLVSMIQSILDLVLTASSLEVSTPSELQGS